MFYNDLAGSVLRADYTMYLVLTYLTMFRLEELTFPEYRKFIETQDPDKMTSFLGYAFDLQRLEQTIKWDWIKIFDIGFVEDEILGPLHEHKEEADKFTHYLNMKASGLAAEKEKSDATAGLKDMPKKSTTIPISPRLTAPAPRAVPQPHRIPQGVQVGKDPTYLERTSLHDVQQAKAQRLVDERERTLRKYTESQVQPFKLHETRNTIDGVRQEVEAKRASELQFDMKHTRPAKLPSGGATVKLNVAAVLREDSLYKKKQENEAAQIKAYEAELRDATEFHRWQTDMRKRDHQGRLEQVERIRMLAKLSADEAREAMEKQREDNNELASHIKAENSAMKKQRELEDEVQLMMNQRLVKEVAEVRDNAPREAEIKVLEERRAKGEALRDEKAALNEEKKRQEEKEQEEKEDRVRKLRALFEEKPTHVTVFDPTESIGLGLLDEMSLVEMKERLAINKVSEEEAIAQKRKDINESKDGKQNDLKKRMENIQRIRRSASSANHEARDRRRLASATQTVRENQIRDAHNAQLLDELEHRRKARAAELKQLADEEERRKNAQGFLNQNAHAAEQKHFSELLQGAEREALKRQTEAQEASKRYEGIKKIDRGIVDTAVKKREVRKAKLYAEKADELERKRRELIQREKEEIASKKLNFQSQRQARKVVREKIIAENPYAHGITEQARQRRTGKL